MTKPQCGLQYPLATLEDTRCLAEHLAQLLQPPLTIGLVGTLGAGKTQFVRFLVAALGVAAENVTSPTYVLQQTYLGSCKIHHFDFYRLDRAAQVWDLGIDELYEQPCIVLIEWADKFPECLPDDCLTVVMTLTDHHSRWAGFRCSGPTSKTLLEHLCIRMNGSI